MMKRYAQREATRKSFVDSGGKVRRQDGNARESFNALEQVVDFEVCIFIVGILDICSLPKERIAFVEKQHCLCIFGFIEYLSQILFRFANVFRHDARQIDLIDIDSDFVGNERRTHALTRSWGPVE